MANEIKQTNKKNKLFIVFTSVSIVEPISPNSNKKNKNKQKYISYSFFIRRFFSTILGVT